MRYQGPEQRRRGRPEAETGQELLTAGPYPRLSVDHIPAPSPHDPRRPGRNLSDALQRVADRALIAAALVARAGRDVRCLQVLLRHRDRAPDPGSSPHTKRGKAMLGTCNALEEIDRSTVASFHTHLRDAIDSSDEALVCIDCSSVTFMDSAGYRALRRRDPLRRPAWSHTRDLRYVAGMREVDPAVQHRWSPALGTTIASGHATASPSRPAGPDPEPIRTTRAGERDVAPDMRTTHTREQFRASVTRRGR